MGGRLATPVQGGHDNIIGARKSRMVSPIVQFFIHSKTSLLAELNEENVGSGSGTMLSSSGAAGETPIQGDRDSGTAVRLSRVALH